MSDRGAGPSGLQNKAKLSARQALAMTAMIVAVEVRILLALGCDFAIKVFVRYCENVIIPLTPEDIK